MVFDLAANRSVLCRWAHERFGFQQVNEPKIVFCKKYLHFFKNEKMKKEKKWFFFLYGTDLTYLLSFIHRAVSVLCVFILCIVNRPSKNWTIISANGSKCHLKWKKLAWQWINGAPQNVTSTFFTLCQGMREVSSLYFWMSENREKIRIKRINP